MDVLLVLDPHQRHLLQPLGAARAQVAVQFLLQEAADLLLPVHLLHDHQRRILGKGLGQHGHTLLVRADDLVRPPLVRELVRTDIGHIVDLGRVA